MLVTFPLSVTSCLTILSGFPWNDLAFHCYYIAFHGGFESISPEKYKGGGAKGENPQQRENPKANFCYQLRKFQIGFWASNNSGALQTRNENVSRTRQPRPWSLRLGLSFKTMKYTVDHFATFLRMEKYACTLKLRLLSTVFLGFGPFLI